MGLFDFLKKKGDAPPVGADVRSRPDGPLVAGPVTRLALDTEAERERQREIARATAAKIDAIELEMTSAIFDDDAWAGITAHRIDRDCKGASHSHLSGERCQLLTFTTSRSA